MTIGTFAPNPAVTAPAESITTDHGAVLIEHERALMALCPVQLDGQLH